MQALFKLFAQFRQLGLALLPTIFVLFPSDLIATVPVTSSAACLEILGSALSGGHGSIEKIEWPGRGFVARKTAKEGQEKMLRREILNLKRLSAQRNVPDSILKFVAEETTADGKPVLIREWADGQTLTNRHLNKTAITQENFNVETKEFMGHMRELFKSMRWMHQNGIYHLDIKGDNLLISKDNKLKVVDLGISTHGSQNPLSYTVGASAPEVKEDVLNPGHIPRITARSDYYSFGLILKNWHSRISETAALNFSEEALRVAFDISLLAKKLTHTNPYKRLNLQQIEESLSSIERSIEQLP